MKVAVSSSGRDLDAEVDPRFGRCAYFIIVDTEDMSFEAFDNENIALGRGAGIQAAQLIASKGARGVITGNCGPNAVRTLNAAGIEVIVGQSGPVRLAVKRYNEGRLSSTREPNVGDHHGIGQAGAKITASFPFARGMGRKMGLGGGEVGRAVGLDPSAGSLDTSGPSNFSMEESLKDLKKQAEEMMSLIEQMELKLRHFEAE